MRESQWDRAIANENVDSVYYPLRFFAGAHDLYPGWAIFQALDNLFILCYAFLKKKGGPFSLK